MKPDQFFAALLLLGVSAGVLNAQESAKELAAKLGSGNYAEREKAAKKLELIGPPALPVLRASLASADLETRRRAVILMERIEDNAIRAEVTHASPLRLQFADVPLDQALLVVQKQTDLFIGFTESKNRLSVDTGILPYWQAWGAFCKAAHLHEFDRMTSAMKLKRPRPDEAEELKMMVASRDLNYRPTFLMPTIEFIQGTPPTRYAVDDRHSVRVRLRCESLDRLEKDQPPHAVFAIEVRPEPRLQLAALPRAEITKIVDAAGREHAVKAASIFPGGYSADEEVYLAAFVGEIQYNGLLQRKSIPWSGPLGTLKEVHGKMRVDVAARPRLIEVPRVFDAVGNAARGYQGVTLKILEAKRNGLRLRVRFDDLDSLTPKGSDPQVVRVRPGVIALRGPMDVAMQRIELIDPRGWKCKPIEASYERAGDGNGYIADFSFEAPAHETDDLTLVMTKETRRVAIDVPFVVRDVAMPEVK